MYKMDIFWHEGRDTIIFENKEKSHYSMTTGWYIQFYLPGCLPIHAPIKLA